MTVKVCRKSLEHHYRKNPKMGQSRARILEERRKWLRKWLKKRGVGGSWSLSEKNGALFLVLVFEMKRMRKKEGKDPNLAFL